MFEKFKKSGRGLDWEDHQSARNLKEALIKGGKVVYTQDRKYSKAELTAMSAEVMKRRDAKVAAANAARRKA